MKNFIYAAIALMVAHAASAMGNHHHDDKYNVKVPCDLKKSLCTKTMTNATSTKYSWMALGGNVSFDADYTEEKTALGECKAGSIIQRVQNALKNALGKLGRRKRQVNMGTVAVNVEHIAHLSDDPACCFVLPYAAVQYSQCNVTDTDMNCCADLQTVVDIAGRSGGERVLASIFSVMAMLVLVQLLL